jgi:hypothetical protein
MPIWANAASKGRIHKPGKGYITFFVAAATFSLTSRRRKRFLPSLAATTPPVLAAAVFPLIGRRLSCLTKDYKDNQCYDYDLSLRNPTIIDQD